MMRPPCHFSALLFNVTMVRVLVSLVFGGVAETTFTATSTVYGKCQYSVWSPPAINTLGSVNSSGATATLPALSMTLVTLG